MRKPSQTELLYFLNSLNISEDDTKNRIKIGLRLLILQWFKVVMVNSIIFLENNKSNILFITIELLN